MIKHDANSSVVTKDLICWYVLFVPSLPRVTFTLSLFLLSDLLTHNNIGIKFVILNSYSQPLTPAGLTTLPAGGLSY
jgi:hypothetical protein